jgi:hypothetical protein
MLYGLTGLTIRVSDGVFDDLDNTTFIAHSEAEFRERLAAAFVEVEASTLARRQARRGRQASGALQLNVLDNSGRWANDGRAGLFRTWEEVCQLAGHLSAVETLGDDLADHLRNR